MPHRILQAYRLNAAASFGFELPPLDLDLAYLQLMSPAYLLQSLEQINLLLKTGLDVELHRREMLLMMQGLPDVKREEEIRVQEIKEAPVEINSEGKKMAVNDTKNIPKNFGKAIIAFITKNPKITEKCLKEHQIELSEFLHELRIKKKNLHSIKELRSLWLDEQFVFAKPFRQLSHCFLTHGSYKYIFGSRVIDYTGHLKYRSRIMEALRFPNDFNSIKK